ncbi:MAG: hypothetical protein H3C49_01090 [Alphaproteobacteria bacterium]|nr:hypothetical protein [Alphaproteobacteria bacterium]HRI76754.1 hypothetical protein [Alphaproteobacteria bacterium]
MFWRWFVSDRKVLEQLVQSGETYDICPNTLQAPANSDEAAPMDANGKPALTLWRDYKYTQEETDIKIDEYWESVSANKGR